MNSGIVLAAEGEPSAVSVGFARARAAIEKYEARFTRFTETSELAALNRSAGQWLQVSPDLFALVCEARLYVEQTRGLFDPSVLDALERAGYDRSMDEIRGRVLGPGRPAPNIMAPDFGAVEFDARTQALRLPPGLRLDLGGIAKGWIAEQAARLLSEYATACAVSAGGDMFLCGLPAGETAWEIGLEDPRAPEEDLAVLRVPGGAVATSSVARRRWMRGDRPMHHLIDPRTREPAESDWLSVTVMAPAAATAEVFAKALLIAGSRDAGEIAARRADVAYIAVDADRQLWASPGALLALGVNFTPIRPVASSVGSSYTGHASH